MSALTRSWRNVGASNFLSCFPSHCSPTGRLTNVSSAILGMLTQTKEFSSNQVIQQAHRTQQTIGSTSLCCGHIALHWGKAQHSLWPHSIRRKPDTTRKWCKELIRGLWTYTTAIWDYWNKTVHGLTSAAAVSKAILALRQEAADLYAVFTNDRYCVPFSRSHLFNHPLHQTQMLPQDALACWVASVREAIATTQSREDKHKAASRNILFSFLGKPIPTNPTPPMEPPLPIYMKDDQGTPQSNAL